MSLTVLNSSLIQDLVRNPRITVGHHVPLGRDRELCIGCSLSYTKTQCKCSFPLWDIPPPLNTWTRTTLLTVSVREGQSRSGVLSSYIWKEAPGDDTGRSRFYYVLCYANTHDLDFLRQVQGYGDWLRIATQHWNTAAREFYCSSQTERSYPFSPEKLQSNATYKHGDTLWVYKLYILFPRAYNLNQLNPS